MAVLAAGVVARGRACGRQDAAGRRSRRDHPAPGRRAADPRRASSSGPDFALGNVTAVTEFEVSVLPAARAGRHGWPRDSDHLGAPVVIHAVSATEYNGEFVVRHPGDYLLVSRSGVYAREDAAAGVTVNEPYVAPVAFRVEAPN